MLDKPQEVTQRPCACAVTHGEISGEMRIRMRVLYARAVQRRMIAEVPAWKRWLCRFIGHTSGNIMAISEDSWIVYSDCDRCCRPIMCHQLITAGWEIDVANELLLQKVVVK